ncbi:MAG: HAD family hydrolase [Methylococcales bacterium]|nr:HAD family hydrolase [Methylococcales bacterium]
MPKPIIYALDFDGVICDSAVETGVTGWKAASRIWTDMPPQIPAEMIGQFRLVRPIIETGYEAILAMRLLYLGETVEAIYNGYGDMIADLLNGAQITVDELKTLFGQTRDSWIAHDLAGWVAMNHLFAGVADKLQAMGQQCVWYVITTKQERFVKHILSAYGIVLEDGRIFGLDRNMSKVAVLGQVVKAHPAHTVHFVEDRLPTLLNVAKDASLADVKLIFALWGYNTDEDKAEAAKQGFTLQQLNDFLVL